MATSKKIKDVYEQLMYLTVTQSASNTLTFSQLSLGAALFDYVGILISRIEYTIGNATLEEMTATTDHIQVAVTGSSSLANLGLYNPEVYDSFSLVRVDQGSVAGDKNLLSAPIIHDYTGFSGGGILVPAQDLYLAMHSGGLANPGTAIMRLYYKFIALTAADYLELAQRLRVLST